MQAQKAFVCFQEEAGPARDMALRQEFESIQQLVERHDARSKQLLHRERLMLISDHVNGRPGPNLNEVRGKRLSVPSLLPKPSP